VRSRAARPRRHRSLARFQFCESARPEWRRVLLCAVTHPVGPERTAADPCFVSAAIADNMPARGITSTPTAPVEPVTSSPTPHSELSLSAYLAEHVQSTTKNVPRTCPDAPGQFDIRQFKLDGQVGDLSTNPHSAVQIESDRTAILSAENRKVPDWPHRSALESIQHPQCAGDPA
jgi:hypothetical protein